MTLHFRPVLFLPVLGALAGFLSLPSCAPSYFPADAAASGAEPVEERPGLATGFGRPVESKLRRESFVRRSSRPAGTDLIYYNNRNGVDAMAASLHEVEALQSAAGGLVEWGIKGRRSWLPSYKSYRGAAGDRRFVVGEPGGAYSLVIRNRCRSRLEVVASVDGLSVLDGKAAGFERRGYLVGPGETLEIEGWRTSMERVARFEFSSVAQSYANLRHGDARNVGVIGLAVFTEKGVDPWTWMPSEIETRERAQPFATAP